MHQDHVEATAQKVLERRSFLKSAGFTGLGLAAAGIGLGLDPAKARAQSTDIDLDILNFALNLEYLEAEFYTMATTGFYLGNFDIGVDGAGNFGPTTGGHRVDFTVPGDSAMTSTITAIAEELAYDEQTHVTLLRSALGSSKVAKPAIALHALGIGFDSLAQFLTLARAFEDVGVSAYGGAAPLITSKEYLGVAARIAEAESNHSGNIRLLCALTGTSVGAVDGLDVVPPPAGKNYFVLNSEALAVVRNTNEVLAIVYGSHAPGANKGRFFPAGLNGAINTFSM